MYIVYSYILCSSRATVIISRVVQQRRAGVGGLFRVWVFVLLKTLLDIIVVYYNNNMMCIVIQCSYGVDDGQIPKREGRRRCIYTETGGYLHWRGGGYYYSVRDKYGGPARCVFFNVCHMRDGGKWSGGEQLTSMDLKKKILNVNTIFFGVSLL